MQVFALYFTPGPSVELNPRDHYICVCMLCVQARVCVMLHALRSCATCVWCYKGVCIQHSVLAAVSNRWGSSALGARTGGLKYFDGSNPYHPSCFSHYCNLTQWVLHVHTFYLLPLLLVLQLGCVNVLLFFTYSCVPKLTPDHVLFIKWLE